MKILAIIPARSGSKGLKDKNIKVLNSKPLLAYSIASAVEANIFDEIIVSTDSQKYADIATKYGAKVPFLRSEQLATDTASIWDGIRDILCQYAKNNMKFDMIALLQPTSPLRTAQDILQAYKMMEENNANSVVSVCEAEHSPQWSNTLPKDNSFVGFFRNELIGVGRQKLPTYYRVNGAIYMVKTSCLQNDDNIYAEKSFAYIMPNQRSVDIDNLLDFKIAEIIMSEFE